VPKPIDLIPELQPTRRETQQDDGNWMVAVTPPAALSKTPSSTATVILSPGQYNRYLMWRRGERLIQEALPELSRGDLEKLMTGLLPDNKVWRDPDGDDHE
jgi:hypothetical protein